MQSKSIKEAVELAFHKDPEKVDLKWYMALTDSIIGTIQCADGNSADQWKQLHEVCSCVVAARLNEIM